MLNNKAPFSSLTIVSSLAQLAVLREDTIGMISSSRSRNGDTLLLMVTFVCAVGASVWGGIWFLTGNSWAGFGPRQALF